MKIIFWLLDLIFPPRRDELILRQTTRSDILNRLEIEHVNDFVYLSNFTDPVIKACISENKFHDSSKASLLLSHLIEDYFLTYKAGPQKIVLSPIPLGQRRQRERGYNQVVRVISSASLAYPTLKLLIRNKETLPQTSLNKVHRQQNLLNAFIIKSNAVKEFRDTTIFLIDDVVTTGSTLEAAKAALVNELHPSCKVTLLALAH